MRASTFLLAILFFASLALLAAAPSPFPQPSSAESLFKNRAFGPLPPPTPTPTPRQIVQEDEEPIPAGWRIGGIVAAVLGVLTLLYGAARAWRSSNLFDRQYRFPAGGKAALRFGGQRCGGHMATLKFDASRVPPASETKDA